MDALNVKINNIKNIVSANIEFPFDNGIYTIVGSNGCGKSTIMLCLAQLISHQLDRLTNSDIKNDSFVEFEINGNKAKWVHNRSGRWTNKGSYLKFNGLYEGSLFYGTRFEDSTNIEQMIASGQITEQEIVDADDYVKKQMSYILHGDLTHYTSLKRIKNKNVAQQLAIKNRPYFISVDGRLVSQYRMSSGECLLVSTLHKELYSKKVLGTNTTIVSILDGDILGNLSKEQKKLTHLFLPIPSIEKFLYSVIKENKNPKLKRIINDKYFIVQSLDEIISQYNKGTLEGSSDNNKNFYKKLISELSGIGTKEAVFISGLCDDIIENIDISKFIESIKKLLVP